MNRRRFSQRYRCTLLCGAIATGIVSFSGCGHAGSNAVIPPTSSVSTNASARTTQSTSSADVVAINVSGPATGAFSADVDGQGGIQSSTSDSININAPNTAPMAVYQTQRYGPMTYVIPGLTAGASYTVRLHFAELYWGAGGHPGGVGSRKFNVAINGTTALTNYDIFAAAGAADTAVAVDTPATADGNGTIAIALTNGAADYAALNGIEILGTAGSPGVTSSEMPRMADAFVDSVGANVHLSEYGTLYGNNFGAVESLLQGAGIRHVRDGMYPNNTSLCNEFASLGATGIHADVISTGNQNDLTSWLGCIGSVAETLEGINEYDLSGDSNWVADLVATTRASAARFSQLPFVAPTATTEANEQAIASLGSLVAYGNTHAYFAGRNPGTTGWGGTDAYGTYGSLAYNLGIASIIAGSKPSMVTETGYSDANDQYAVPPITKARYSLRTLLTAWNAGVARTYFYELVDEGGPPFSHYGIVDAGGNPKPVYSAIASLLNALKDPGGSFSTTPLTYAMNAGPTVAHTLLQKRNGTYVLIVWNEVSEWDPNANATIGTAPQTVQLTFNRAPSAIQQLTFSDSGTTTTASIPTGTTVSLTASAWPTIVNVTP